MSWTIILLGTGGFGRAWRRGIAEIDDAHVVAAVDPKREAREEAAAHYGLPPERCLAPNDRWEEIAANLVIDATPHPYHVGNARRAYPAGKSHLVSKPLADTWAGGVEMVRLAEKHGVRLAVGQQLRYHPLIQKVRTLVAEGSIGQPTQLLLDFVNPMDGYAYRAWKQAHPLLVESAVHQADYIRYVLDADALSVMCETWTPSYLPQDMALCAVAAYRMTNDVAVCYRGISSRDTSLLAGWLGRWMLEGDEGVIRVIGREVTLNGAPIRWSWGRDAPGIDADLDFAGLNAHVLRDMAEYMHRQGAGHQRPSEPQQPAHGHGCHRVLGDGSAGGPLSRRARRAADMK